MMSITYCPEKKTYWKIKKISRKQALLQSNMVPTYQVNYLLSHQLASHPLVFFFFTCPTAWLISYTAFQAPHEAHFGKAQNRFLQHVRYITVINDSL